MDIRTVHSVRKYVSELFPAEQEQCLNPSSFQIFFSYQVKGCRTKKLKNGQSKIVWYQHILIEIKKNHMEQAGFEPRSLVSR